MGWGIIPQICLRLEQPRATDMNCSAGLLCLLGALTYYQVPGY